MAGDTTHQDPTPLVDKLEEAPLDWLASISGMSEPQPLFGSFAVDLLLAHFGCSSEAELVELINIGRRAQRATVSESSVSSTIYVNVDGVAYEYADDLLDALRGSALSVAPEATGEHDDCQHNVDQDSDCADDRSFTRVRDLMSEDERKAMYDDLGKLARLRSRVPDCPHTPVTQQGSKQCVCGEPNDADVHRFDRSPGSPKATT